MENSACKNTAEHSFAPQTRWVLGHLLAICTGPMLSMLLPVWGPARSYNMRSQCSDL